MRRAVDSARWGWSRLAVKAVAWASTLLGAGSCGIYEKPVPVYGVEIPRCQSTAQCQEEVGADWVCGADAYCVWQRSADAGTADTGELP